MARRATAGRFGFMVPGLSNALAARWDALDARWSGREIGTYAEAARTGAVIVDGMECWMALYPAMPRVAAQFEGDEGVYEVTGDEVVPVAADDGPSVGASASASAGVRR